MGDCENFKSPKSLGLKICTSDVSCYDGVSLQCIDLPSNPNLNDVIAAVDSEICTIKDLLNNIVVPAPVIPEDPWVYLTDASPEITGFTFSGTATEVSKELHVAYKVESASHVTVKVRADLTVLIISPERSIDFRFFIANLQAADTSFFDTGEKIFTSFLPDFLGGTGTSFGVPVSVVRLGGDALDTHFEDYRSKGRAAATNGQIFCQRVAPLPELAQGEHNFLVEFEMTCKLEDA